MKLKVALLVGQHISLETHTKIMPMSHLPSNVLRSVSWFTVGAVSRTKKHWMNKKDGQVQKEISQKFIFNRFQYYFHDHI